jgi:hypothetical protein
MKSAKLSCDYQPQDQNRNPFCVCKRGSYCGFPLVDFSTDGECPNGQAAVPKDDSPTTHRFFSPQIAYNSPSMTVAVRSFAKINFELYIGAAHADGYHDPRRCTRPAEDFSPDTPASSRRVAPAFDLAGTTSAGGAPSFAHFAKGGSWNVHTMGRTACRIDGIASRPCKERKDGALTVVLSERKPKPKTGPPAFS